MPRIQLVTDVSKWGLLKWPARTRRRLVASTVAVSILTIAMGMWSAHYILVASSSVMVNLLVITITMMVVLITAFMQSILVGDLFFPGPWREHVFLGNKPEGDKLDINVIDDHSAEFTIVLILLVIANAFALNLVTGGFLDQYHNEGFFQVRMRSDSPQERIATLQKLAEPNNYSLWERPAIQELIIDAFDDPHEDVRKQAVWNVGDLEMSIAREPVHALLVNPDIPDPVRGEAAVALGKLGEDTDARDSLQAIAAAAEASTELRVDALRGLGLMASPRAVPDVAKLIDDPDETVMIYAFWVLARIGSDQARDSVREVIDSELGSEAPLGPRACAALDAFKMVATEDDTMWARRQFQRFDTTQICEGVLWEERDGRPQQIVWGESVRLKLLKIVANTNPFDHRDWIQRLVNDPDEDWYLREVADEILRQMNRVKKH
ncbi:MAG: HEAT repeat domain-containing protein [Bradymonadaceae bacterium]